MLVRETRLALKLDQSEPWVYALHLFVFLVKQKMAQAEPNYNDQWGDWKKPQQDGVNFAMLVGPPTLPSSFYSLDLLTQPIFQEYDDVALEIRWNKVLACVYDLFVNVLKPEVLWACINPVHRLREATLHSELQQGDAKVWTWAHLLYAYYCVTTARLPGAIVGAHPAPLSVSTMIAFHKAIHMVNAAYQEASAPMARACWRNLSALSDHEFYVFWSCLKSFDVTKLWEALSAHICASHAFILSATPSFGAVALSAGGLEQSVSDADAGKKVFGAHMRTLEQETKRRIAAHDAKPANPIVVMHAGGGDLGGTRMPFAYDAAAFLDDANVQALAEPLLIGILQGIRSMPLPILEKFVCRGSPTTESLRVALDAAPELKALVQTLTDEDAKKIDLIVQHTPKFASNFCRLLTYFVAVSCEKAPADAQPDVLQPLQPQPEKLDTVIPPTPKPVTVLDQIVVTGSGPNDGAITVTGATVAAAAKPPSAWSFMNGGGAPKPVALDL
jgi:hypothetical protein